MSESLDLHLLKINSHYNLEIVRANRLVVLEYLSPTVSPLIKSQNESKLGVIIVREIEQIKKKTVVLIFMLIVLKVIFYL